MNTSQSSKRYCYRYVKRSNPHRLNQTVAIVAIMAAILCFGMVFLSIR